MFGLFASDPKKKLEKQLARKLEEAMALQRGGDMKGFAAKTAEANEIEQELVKLES